MNDTIDYAGNHIYRSNGADIAPRCTYPDCDARPGAPQHRANQSMIDAAHAQALVERQYRICQVYGMGRRTSAREPAA